MNVKGRMMCPVCEVKLSIADRQGVEIDFCPQCRGVWLDRGELDKIIERTAEELAPQRTPESQRSGYYARRVDHGRHGGKHGGHRRKSWLAEIFD